MCDDESVREKLSVIIKTWFDNIKSSYKVHAFDYISKPVNENEICKVLLVAVQYLDNALKKNKYAFDTEEGSITLDLDDIYYFEYLARKVIINSSKGKYTSSYSLKELLENKGMCLPEGLQKINSYRTTKRKKDNIPTSFSHFNMVK